MLVFFREFYLFAVTVLSCSCCQVAGSADDGVLYSEVHPFRSPVVSAGRFGPPFALVLDLVFGWCYQDAFGRGEGVPAPSDPSSHLVYLG